MSLEDVKGFTVEGTKLLNLMQSWRIATEDSSSFSEISESSYCTKIIKEFSKNEILEVILRNLETGKKDIRYYILAGKLIGCSPVPFYYTGKIEGLGYLWIAILKAYFEK